jgi:methionyl-tRNA formyltransferase
LRVVFMGTPEFAVPTLAEIVGAGHEVAAVYTRAPTPAGRGMAERKSPVHQWAEASGIAVATPASLRAADVQAAFAAHAADVGVVVAYGLILPKPVLEAPRLGCLNLHGSALPRWRGAAPIQRAIIAGDAATAVMVMRMDEGLDTGPVCLSEPLEIGPGTTAGELHDVMAREGAGLMVRALAALARDSLVCTPQASDGVTYAAKIDKAEARIDFTRPAGDVHNLVRALSPFPGAWFEAEAGGRRERIKVLRTALVEARGVPGAVLDVGPTIACGSGAIRLVEVQRAGKKPMSAAELMRGFALDVAR